MVNGIKLINAMHWYQAESQFVCNVLSIINSLNSILNFSIYNGARWYARCPPDLQLSLYQWGMSCRLVLPYYHNKLWAEGLSIGGWVVNLIFGLEQHLIWLISLESFTTDSSSVLITYHSIKVIQFMKRSTIKLAKPSWFTVYHPRPHVF